MTTEEWDAIPQHKPQDRIFFIDEERALFNGIKSGEISLSKFVELLNEKYKNNHPYKEEVDKDKDAFNIQHLEKHLVFLPVIPGLYNLKATVLENGDSIFEFVDNFLESKEEAGMKENKNE